METFKNIGRILNRSDDKWPAVRRNVGKAHRVWSRLGKLLRREGADPQISEMFYLAVLQAVLLFGAETWVLLTEMSRKLEGLHVGFLRQVTGQKAKWQREGTWRSVAAADVIKESGTHTLLLYIDKRQATVAKWVVLRLILEILDT